MQYYKSGSKPGTVDLRWNPFPSRLKGLFRANEIIGNVWTSIYTVCGQFCDDYKTAIRVLGTYRLGNLNSISCCGPRPSRGGKIQYRAYNCKPQTYKQLMSGIVINQKARWSDVRQKLNLNASSVCERIWVVAFFIPSPQDIKVRKLKATFSVLRSFWVCPACVNNIWGDACSSPVYSERTVCNCPSNASALFRCPLPQ
jgi:hypothetical protein